MAEVEIHRTTRFCEDFLEEYLAGGLGRMQKRDIDVLVMHLLLQDGRYSFPTDIYKACRELKLTETRVRNLYQEAQLRYDQLGEADAKADLVELIRKKAFEVKGNRIVFVVRNPMLGQYFQEWVAAVDGFTDSSFNPHLVTVHKEIFLKILRKISADEIADFPDDLEVFNQAASKPALLDLFVEQLIKSAGTEAGRMSATALAKGLAIIFGMG